MTTLSNVHLIALGINEVRHGSAVVEGGIAHIAEGIYAAWNTPIRWSYGSGDNEVSGAVNLGDMFKGRRHPDGSEDSKFLPAMYRAVAECFGVEGEFSTADKQAFGRAFAVAAAKVAGTEIEFVDTEIERKGKAVKVRAVQVPAAVALKLTDDNGKLSEVGSKVVDSIKSNAKLFGKGAAKKLTDEQALEKAREYEVACVGGRDAVLGKVPSSTDIANTLRAVASAAGFMSPPKSRNGSSSGDKFGASLEFVNKALALFLSDKGDESDLAPCDALEAKMRVTAELIANYFAK